MKVATKKKAKTIGIVLAAIVLGSFVITRLTRGEGKTTMTEPFNQIKNLFT